MARSWTVGPMRPPPVKATRLGSLRRAAAERPRPGMALAAGPPPAAAAASPSQPRKKGCCRSGCEGCPWTEARRHRLGV